MNRHQVIEKINDFLVDEFEIDIADISPELNMNETLELDSLDYVDMVVVIENIFGFKVKGEDFTSIKTFEDFYSYIYTKVKSNAA